jgi:hypothetical protein
MAGDGGGWRGMAGDGKGYGRCRGWRGMAKGTAGEGDGGGWQRVRQVKGMAGGAKDYI